MAVPPSSSWCACTLCLIAARLDLRRLALVACATPRSPIVLQGRAWPATSIVAMRSRRWGWAQAQRWANARVVTGGVLPVTTLYHRMAPCQRPCCAKSWSEVMSGSKARPSIGATGLEPLPSAAVLNRTCTALQRPDRCAPADPRHRIIQTCAKHTPWTLGQWSPRVLCPQARHAAPQRVQRRRAVNNLAQTGVVSRVPCDSRRAAARGMDRNTYPSSWHHAVPNDVVAR